MQTAFFLLALNQNGAHHLPHMKCKLLPRLLCETGRSWPRAQAAPACAPCHLVTHTGPRANEQPPSSADPQQPQSGASSLIHQRPQGDQESPLAELYPSRPVSLGSQRPWFYKLDGHHLSGRGQGNPTQSGPVHTARTPGSNKTHPTPHLSLCTGKSYTYALIRIEGKVDV